MDLSTAGRALLQNTTANATNATVAVVSTKTQWLPPTSEPSVSAWDALDVQSAPPPWGGGGPGSCMCVRHPCACGRQRSLRPQAAMQQLHISSAPLAG